MELIQHLLSKIVSVVMILLALVFLFWLGRVISPLLPHEWFPSKDTVLAKKATSTEFFLPTPVDLGKNGAHTPTATDNLFVFDGKEASLEAYDSASVYQTGSPQGTWQRDRNGQYVFVQHVYTVDPSVKDTQGPVFDATKSGFAQMSAYLRSITIPPGAYVYRGLTFHGQAREQMFVNGKFSLFVIDARGNVIGTGEAVTHENSQAVGWHPFSAHILTLGVSSTKACGLVFQQDVARGLHATLPVVCP
jgi:hypothetical protein